MTTDFNTIQPTIFQPAPRAEMVHSAPISYVAPNAWERPADWYGNHFVATNAAIGTLLTPGSVGNKLQAGARSGVEAAIFQKVARWMGKQQKKFYLNHPGYAKWANENPIVSSLVNGAVIFIPGAIAMTLGGLGFSKLFNLIRGDRALEALDNSRAGSKLNRFFSSPGMQKARIGLTWAITIGFPLYFIGLGVKRLVDSAKYKREYNEAKVAHPEMDTYDLRNLAATERLSDYFEAHPKQLQQLQG